MSQYYYPDNFRINEIAAELVRQGHTVNVLTGLPDYTTSHIPAEYRFFSKRHEVVEGVSITRVPIIARRRGAFFRALNYLSFAACSSVYALCHGTDADVLLAPQTSPVFQVTAAIVWKRCFKKRLVLYCYDLWPESLKAWWAGENNPAFSIVKWLSSRIYRACDVVAVTSEPFVQYLSQVCGVDKARLVYLPQHAEDAYADLVRDYDDNGVVDFLFAGNIGAVQNVECILQATAKLPAEKPFCVHIVGDGSRLEACRQLAQELGLGARVIFHGRHPQEAMHSFYRTADCFLLTLSGDSFIGMTLPGKAQGYLSAGRPIVGAIDGAGAQMIAQADCGAAAKAGDSDGLAGLMLEVIDNQDTYRAKGLHGRDFYTKYYTKECFMAGLLKLLERS